MDFPLGENTGWLSRALLPSVIFLGGADPSDGTSQISSLVDQASWLPIGRFMANAICLPSGDQRVECFALQQLSSLAAADDDRGRIGKEAETLPLFDAHMHYKREAWGPFPPDVILSLMDATACWTIPSLA